MKVMTLAQGLHVCIFFVVILVPERKSKAGY
jgi:hypothetical protein